MKRDPFPVLLDAEERQILNRGKTLSGAKSLGEFLRNAGLRETKRLEKAASKAGEPAKEPE